MAGFESLFKNGSYGRAMEMLETAEAAFPQHRFLYRLYTASCLEQTGRQEEAAALYEELLAQQPENGHALFLRALQLQDQKQYAEALGHFDRIPVDSAHYQRINRIGTLYQMGQTERASTEGLAIWNEIGQDEKIDSEDKATLAFSLSRCFEKLGMKTEASQWAEETKRISPFYGLILDANEERGPALSLAQALTAEMEKDLHDSENWRSLLEFTKESADPQVVSHVRNWIEGVKGQLNFCLVYQAARQQEAAPLLLERLLPPTDKAALDKFEGSLEEGGMHSDAVALLRSAPSALQADPEVKVRLLWNLYLLKEWDTVTAQNLEALQRTLASASRSHQLLKVLRANILRAEGKTDEALRLYREVLAHQTVRKDPTNNDLELEVRMGIYHITFAGKRDDASVLGALRLMRPLMTRSQFEESAFTVMADIIEAAPPYLAKEIMVATRDHIELVRGTLPHALRVFMPRARKEDASPQLQDLANWLDETFNCEREIEG
jgi:tetratricopeptide (TPR) repeat protein